MPWKNNKPMDQRIEFAMKAMETENFRALCDEYGISAKTGYKWRERFLRHGMAGMEEWSRRPKGHANQLPEGVVCEMVRLKGAHPHWGPRKIRELYLRRHGTAASESSFKRILEHAGLTQPRRRRRRQPRDAFGVAGGRRAPMKCGRWTSKAGGMTEREPVAN